MPVTNHCRRRSVPSATLALRFHETPCRPLSPDAPPPLDALPPCFPSHRHRPREKRPIGPGASVTSCPHTPLPSGPSLRNCATFGAVRRRREFFDSPIVRRDAHSCAQLESPRARVPYMAGVEFFAATLLRVSAQTNYRTRYQAAYGPLSFTNPTTAAPIRQKVVTDPRQSAVPLRTAPFRSLFSEYDAAHS